MPGKVIAGRAGRGIYRGFGPRTVRELASITSAGRRTQCRGAGRILENVRDAAKGDAFHRHQERHGYARPRRRRKYHGVVKFDVIRQRTRPGGGRRAYVVFANALAARWSGTTNRRHHRGDAVGPGSTTSAKAFRPHVGVGIAEQRCVTFAAAAARVTAVCAISRRSQPPTPVVSPTSQHQFAMSASPWIAQGWSRRWSDARGAFDLAYCARCPIT